MKLIIVLIATSIVLAMWTVVFVYKSNAAETRTITLKPVVCDVTQTMRQNLNQRYGETKVISAVLSGEKNLMHIYVNKETGTWSVIILDTSKVSCLILYGDGFTPILNRGSRS